MVGVVARMQGGSLVDQIAEERRRADIERARDRKRRTRRRIVLALAGLAFLAAATVAGALAIERMRIVDRLENVEGHLAISTPAELETAAEEMDKNLVSAPGDSASLGLLAYVRVHQFAAGLVEESEVEEALAAAEEAESEGVSLARGIFAALTGDYDEARRVFDATMAQQERTVVENNDVVWLQGLLALATPYEQERVEAALAAANAAVESNADWTANRRIAVALRFRTGDPDGALALIAEGREANPNNVGLAVDDALYHAGARKEVSGVLEVAPQLLQNQQITPNDRVYVKLANALAMLHEGKDAAENELSGAWESLPGWDNHARDLVLDALLSAGQAKVAKKWKEEISFGPVADGIYEAWIYIIEGDTPKALKGLAELPQQHPRVAHLQALALVEQRRWGEAIQWLEYVDERSGSNRPDLQVSKARVEVHTADAKAALETLEKIADDHPGTHRVWTALAETHAKLENDKETGKALDKAIERETAPAEAWWMRAERSKKEALEKPKAGKDALEAFQKAAELNGHVARYQASLGMFLAHLGRYEPAQKKLRAVSEAPGLEWQAILTLADIVSKTSYDKKSPVPQEVEGWLKRSAELAAPVQRQDLSWARYELAQGKPETLAKAQARAERILEAEPRNIEARVLHAQTLVAQGEYVAARASLERGIRRTLKKVDGPLYLMEARVEYARGKKRPAAGLAFKGWRKMVKDPATPAELLDAAPFVADLFLNINQPRPAKTVGRELARLIPYDVDAWVFRGEMEFADGENKEGCSAADKAMKIAPKDPGALALKGDCHVKRFEFDKARAVYAKAIEGAEGTPKVRDYQRKLRRLQ